MRYVHNALHELPGIAVPGAAWMLDLDDNSCNEILALAFVEHLTYWEACDTFRNVHRMLRPGGAFLFDVPHHPVWCRYYLAHLHGETWPPVPMDHVRRTLFGWGRWPGDEHKYGWDREHLDETLRDCGLTPTFGLSPFLARGLHRARFQRPEDAHLYVRAVK